MDSTEVREILTNVGAIIGGHFVFTSGKHGDTYVCKDLLYPHPTQTSRLCQEIALRFADIDMDAVVAPEKGGIILSYLVAYHLTTLTGREVLSYYAEKDPTVESGFTLRRGNALEILPGKRVLVVEDVLNTGGSVKRLVEFLRHDVGCAIVGVSALCNRGEVTAFDVGDPPRLVTLADIKMSAWDAADCPLCAQEVEVNMTVGHGVKSLAEQAA